MRINRKRLTIVITVFIFILVFSRTSYGRYVYQGIRTYLLETQGFYFNSSVLSTTDNKYNINNWDGVNDYPLNIDVNNYKNDDLFSNSDISYEISVSCSDNVTCTTDKTEGIIYKDAKTDSYIITVTPKDSILENEIVEVKTSVRSTSPYEKVLSATYTLGVEISDFSYNIVDSVGSKYLTLQLTNSLSYYKALEAFGSFQKDDLISLDEYNELSSEDKKKCFSAKVTLSFDSNLIYLDLSSDTYNNLITSSTEVINNYNYVSGYEFYVLANSNTEIKFYKKQINDDYTYPIVNNSSIVNVEVVTAKQN